MRKLKSTWARKKGNKPNVIHYLLSNLSLYVRRKQYNLFYKLLKPKKADKIGDVGVSSLEELTDTNFFEKSYPYPDRLTAISIDDPLDFNKKYPKINYQQIVTGKPLPYINNNFDIIVSWATLEHVGNRQKQQFFLGEMFRIGKKIFITTPYRGCPYEPHSGLFFVHWLPRKWFEIICHHLKKEFWASEENLRSMWVKELKEILPESNKTKIIIYKTFGIIPSHLIIVKT